MRKLLLTVVGAAAMATASMASAAVTVTGSSGLTTLQDPFLQSGLVQNNPDGSSNISFGIQPVPFPNFSGSFDFSNSIDGERCGDGHRIERIDRDSGPVPELELGDEQP